MCFAPQASQGTLNNVQASNKWVTNFKGKHNIVSRKATKYVTSKHESNEDELKKKAKAFGLCSDRSKRHPTRWPRKLL